MNATIGSKGWRAAVGGRFVVFALLAILVFATSRLVDSVRSRQLRTGSPLVASRSVQDELAESRDLVLFLERRVRNDPGDAGAYSKLSGLYLQQLRETGSLESLQLALHAAQTSLDIVPPARNTSGLRSLALAQFAEHEFASAAGNARRLIELDSTGSPYAILGDALIELGDYAGAKRAFAEMQRRSRGVDENVATRLARFAQLEGTNADATRWYAKALAMALARGKPSHDRMAWYDWQLGETAFASGDYATAQNEYEAALETYPGYYRALAGLGRVLAARGDLLGAIDRYRAAIRVLPDPTFVAALGDVYELSGRPREAAVQYDLVEFIGHVGVLNGVLYNRQLAIFHADHDRKTREAYTDAEREYAARRDIYGADAVAWAALKAGKLQAAQRAERAALRLGTKDARLFYHAGMIAAAAGEREAAYSYLQRALGLSPEFDPLQAKRAREALASQSVTAIARRAPDPFENGVLSPYPRGATSK